MSSYRLTCLALNAARHLIHVGSARVARSAVWDSVERGYGYLTTTHVQGARCVSLCEILPRSMPFRSLKPRHEAAACLCRAWVIVRLMKATQIAMGEIGVVTRSEVKAEDGKTMKTVTSETTTDIRAALRPLELLTKEVDRREVDLAVVSEGDDSL